MTQQHKRLFDKIKAAYADPNIDVKVAARAFMDIPRKVGFPFKDFEEARHQGLKARAKVKVTPAQRKARTEARAAAKKERANAAG